MIDTAWIALIGTVFGGAGLKIVEGFLSRGQDKVDTATELRDELRKESGDLRKEIKQVEKELDQWKERYFLLLQEFLEIKGHLERVDPNHNLNRKEVEKFDSFGENRDREE